MCCGLACCPMKIHELLLAHPPHRSQPELRASMDIHSGFFWFLDQKHHQRVTADDGRCAVLARSIARDQLLVPLGHACSVNSLKLCPHSSLHRHWPLCQCDFLGPRKVVKIAATHIACVCVLTPRVSKPCNSPLRYKQHLAHNCLIFNHCYDDYGPTCWPKTEVTTLARIRQHLWL
jgi:hypothetical protein